jgi:hypothetical protein
VTGAAPLTAPTGALFGRSTKIVTLWFGGCNGHADASGGCPILADRYKPGAGKHLQRSLLATPLGQFGALGRHQTEVR